MNRLENELRHAMKREDPPEGFAERVISRAAETRQAARTTVFMRPVFRWALAGAMCLLFAVAGIEYRQARHERARGEAAKAQLMLGLRITADKLQLVQAKVQQIGNPQHY
jgi:hypothetical protein